MQNLSDNHGLLVLCRHAESEWNAKGIWTGLTDVNLSKKGNTDAALLGQQLRDVAFDELYTSDLKRTHQTLQGILDGISNQTGLPHTKHAALNERDYGDLTGKNKWEVKQAVGEADFAGIRRGWNHPVPGGETLKDVHDRVVPYFEDTILPKLHNGQNILIVAHGNTIRALIKHLEDITDEKIADVEMPFTDILIYHFLPGLRKPHEKIVRHINTQTSQA
jgi:2,3-bisphosphoglycerate-dependent phosphoglycerate mutase